MFKDLIKTLEAMEKALEKNVRAILNDCAFRVKERVDSQEFIHWRSKRKPIVVEKARLVGNLLTATVRTASHWTWGHVLVGPPGSTTITPQKGQFLALPTDFAKQTNRTKAQGPKAYAGTRIFAGIIWGRAGWGGAGTGGGLRQHRAAGEKFNKETLIPLFILKGSVVVKRRDIPEEQVAWVLPYFQEQLRAKGLVP